MMKCYFESKQAADLEYSTMVLLDSLVLDSGLFQLDAECYWLSSSMMLIYCTSVPSPPCHL